MPFERRPGSGFTLIELMITLTILGIMMGLGVPAFRNFIASQKIKAATFDLTTSVLMARSEAVKRNTDITIAPDTANAWTGGWTVKAGTITIVQQAAIESVTITKGPSTIVFKATGRPTAGSNFEVTGNSGVKCVKVDASGIPSTQSAACP